MGKSFKLKFDNATTFHICPSRNCKVNPDDIIPTYYSELHAIDMGWTKTSDIVFCPPDKQFVWVCNDCKNSYIKIYLIVPYQYIDKNIKGTDNETTRIT